MDDLVESMQLKHKLVSLRNKMTVTQRSLVINKILEGLLKETTPLSDYYIQSSVGSLLEYISQEKESMTSNAQIIIRSAQIFKQMTIGENSGLANGRSIKFGKSVTQSLFNFANNLFSQDFTALIGGSKIYLSMNIYSRATCNESDVLGWTQEHSQGFSVKHDSWRCRWL
jgi:hypothetical protein